MKPTAPNPLLSEPPESYHRLRDTITFRRITGRAPVASDYLGVHTTDSAAVAAAYAISAWTLRGERDDDMPVLIRLRTDGLEPLPDVDAMLQGMPIYDAIRSEIAESLASGESEKAIERSFEDYALESDLADLVGLDPASVVFDDIMTRPPNPVSLLIEYGGENALARFARDGQAPDGRALSEIVRQRKYMSNFDRDRVVGIDAVRPWWGEIVNEDEENAVAAIHDAGWTVVTFDDAASGRIEPAILNIYGKALGGEADYHGTTLGALRAAFPGIRLHAGFDPPTPRDQVAVTARGEDIEDEEL